MLEAKNRVTGEIVKAWKMTSAEGVLLKNEIARMKTKTLLTCFDPECGCDRYIKAIDSQFVTMHFARYPGTGKANCGGTGESIEHMIAKAKLALWLQEQNPLSEITTEMVIKTPGGYKPTRRIDVAETTPDGVIYAHEIQRSKQDAAVTQQRTMDYIGAGISSVVWWWIGDHYQSVEWCIKTLEYYGIMKPVYTGEKLHDFIITKTTCADVIEKRRVASERRSSANAAADSWLMQRNLREKKTAERIEIAFEMKGKSLPTMHGGKAIITDYNKRLDIYRSGSRQWWKIENGVMVEVGDPQ